MLYVTQELELVSNKRNQIENKRKLHLNSNSNTFKRKYKKVNLNFDLFKNYLKLLSLKH